MFPTQPSNHIRRASEAVHGPCSDSNRIIFSQLYLYFITMVYPRFEFTRISMLIMAMASMHGQVNAGCRAGGKPADVLFLLDASGSIWKPHFNQQLRFVASIITEFDVSPFKTRVGVMTFSGYPRVHIDLADGGRRTGRALMRAVDRIPQSRGSTDTGKAIRKARAMMAASGRDGVAKLLIVFTDGESDDPFRTIKEARLTHAAGINVFAIGIGKDARQRELQSIASRGQYVFTVSSYPALKSIKSLLAIKACQVEDIAVRDEGYRPSQEDCGGKPADVVFVLDSSNSIWKLDFERQLDFVQSTVRLFTVRPDHSRVSVLTFSDGVTDQFPLKRHRDRPSVLTAIAGINRTLGDTYTGKALHYVWRKSFSANHGARKHVPHIAVVITDGRSSDPRRTRIEASRARAHGVHIFAVGVGRFVDTKELRAIAGSDEDVFTVTDYKALKSIREMLAIKACQAIKGNGDTQRKATIVPKYPSRKSQAVNGACGSGVRADVVFGMSGVRKAEDSNKVLELIREVTSDMDIGEDSVRIGLVPKQCSGLPEMQLKGTMSKNDVIEHLDHMTTPTESHTASVLKYMRKTSFSVNNGARESGTCKRLAVLVLDENVVDLQKAIKEARKAESKENVELYVIGVGRQIPPGALRSLATKPETQHIIQVSSFQDLPSVKEKLMTAVCKNK